MHRDRGIALVIDDEGAERDRLCRWFAGQGCDVRTRRYRDRRIEEAPLLVVVRLTGLTDPARDEALRFARRCSIGARLCAVVAAGDARGMRRAFLGGAVDCLEEPITEAGLEDAFKPHLQAPAVNVAQRADPGAGSPEALLSRVERLRQRADALGRTFCLALLARPRRQRRALADALLDERFERAFSTAVSEALADHDAAAPYTFDQFVLGLADCDESQAAARVDGVRDRVQALADVERGAVGEWHASAGVAEYRPGSQESIRDLIDRATDALNLARRRPHASTVTWAQWRRSATTRRALEQIESEDVTLWATRVRQHLSHTRDEVTRALVAAVEAKDPYTNLHSEKVAEYADRIAARLGLSPRQSAVLRNAAVLHDVGKLGVPDAILCKPGPLTDEEFQTIKRHPRIGVDILRHISHLTAELPLILHHHERFDGSGYPDGLAGDAIPFGARILAVADALDAMLSRRSYKEPFKIDRAMDELVQQKGRQFDPVVVDHTIECLTAGGC
ncbi:MAG: HD domain-containing protein [Phycisphaerales bacterium]|nr:MAG: HD domain-containing protein [Phycisphaerales bacterium]